MCGGKGESKIADYDAMEVCNNIKSAVEIMTNLTYQVFKPVLYRTQMVAGINYFIKIEVDDYKYIHIKVFKSLPCYGGEYVVSDLQTDMALESAI